MSVEWIGRPTQNVEFPCRIIPPLRLPRRGSEERLADPFTNEFILRCPLGGKNGHRPSQSQNPSIPFRTLLKVDSVTNRHTWSSPVRIGVFLTFTEVTPVQIRLGTPFFIKHLRVLTFRWNPLGVRSNFLLENLLRPLTAFQRWVGPKWAYRRIML